MMDKEKLEQAIELLKDSGVETCVLVIKDGTYQTSLLNGMGIDIVRALYALMDEDHLFGFLAGVAVKKYLEEIKQNKNNKQHGKQQ